MDTQLNCYKARARVLREHFPWSNVLQPLWTGFLVHLSTSVPGKIAYYASVDNMVTGRLTRTSPEMFLERNLQYAPDEIRGAWSNEVLGATLPELSFIENDDPDGWYNVYETGPGSCMQGSTRVRQYAHPSNNLALAYHKNDVGTITHRTIVNKKHKTYVRVYGGDSSFFVAALNKHGYTRSDDTLLDEIVRLDRVHCENCDTEILAGPYLDGSHSLIEPTNRNEGVIGDNGDEPFYSADYHCGCDSDDYDNDNED